MAKTIQYEKRPCTRCGGSGNYSYCQRYGTVCFKCGGKGTQLSANGKRAKKAVNAWKDENLETPVDEMVPGQKYWVEWSVFAGGEIRRAAGWRKFAEVTPSKSGAVNPETGKVFEDSITVRFENVETSFGGRRSNTSYRRLWNEAEFAEMVKVASRFKGATIVEE